MSETQNYRCSHCGKQEATDIRYLACGSTSQWDKNNYPAPNTTLTTKDDIKVWEVALCDSCMPSSYKVFLQNRIRQSLKLLGICSFLLAIAFVGIYTGAATSGVYFLRMLLGFALAIGLIIGIIGVPTNLIILSVNSVRLRNLNRSGAIAEKNKAKSFIGEGQRLIKEIEKNQAPEIESDFPLPKFREFKDLPLTDKEKEKVINKVHGRGERSIVAVAKTLQDLEKALLPEWQSVLKSPQ